MRYGLALAAPALFAFVGLLHQQFKLYSDVVQLRSTLAHTQQLQAEAQRRALDAEALLAGRRRVSEAEAAAPVSTRGYVHSPSALPLKPGTLVMTTYATGGVREMLRNWVLHVRRLQSPLLVCAMDDAIVRQCTAQRFDCLDWRDRRGAAKDFGEYVRGDELGFRLLGVRKVDALLAILQAGVHLVLSDVDCVWSADPLPFVLGTRHGYEALAKADVLIATDCMSPVSDFGGNGCAFDGVDKNTGVFAVRATDNGIATMAEWRVRLAMGQKNEQDQTTFVDLLDGNGRGHRWGLSGAERTRWCAFASRWCLDREPQGCHGGQHTGMSRFASVSTATAVPGSRSLIDVCLPNVTRDMRLGIFPTTEVAGGHTFFVQQYQASTGRWPRAVHATYQFGDATDYPFGKRQRFRDWGLWLADDADTYIGEPGAARYLVLDDEAPPTRVAPLPANRNDPEQLLARGRQHVRHLEQTRQRLAHGVALARALNRTLVLPQLWCYCDKFWSRLSGCAISDAAGSQPLPFACPMDHVVEPQNWHGSSSARARRREPGMLASRPDGPWSEGMPYRGHYWLRQLGAHPAIGMSSARLTKTATAEGVPRGPVPRALLQMAAERLPALRPGLTHEFVPGEPGPRLVLPSKPLSDAQLRDVLEPYEHVALLRVGLQEAGELLHCHEKQSDVTELRQLTSLLFQHSWCYRNSEMTAEWSRIETRGPKPRRGTEPWCAWGFAEPSVQGACEAPAA